MTTFINGSILTAEQLNPAFDAKLDATSALPLNLTGAGTQLTVAGTANLATVAITGVATATTPSPGDSSTQIATTAFVATSFATKASPTFTGTPVSVTPTAGDSSTKIATTAFVATSFALLASPNFSGTPLAPTATVGTNTTQLATTAFVTAAVTSSGGYAPGAVGITGGSVNGTTIGNSNPSTGVFTTLTANTASAGTNTTQVATTAFVTTALTSSAVRVVTASGGVTHLTTDQIIVVAKTTPATTALTLMSSPPTGKTVVVKDGSGNSATFAITISPAAGTIDGAATVVMNTNYSSVALVYNGTSWNIV